ncbi:MAG TPA: PAS domain-containing protein [Candidatus Dormibacteraeota bacterium]|nr:PAS domain-containing protein [Candidatus Dormibacteraeota bacterium]
MKRGRTAADRDALMKAIKTALKQGLWDETLARPTFSRYLSLFILNPEPMWVYDVDTLEILDANDAAMRRYGYSRHEFLALTIKALRPDEDVPKFLELIRDTPNSDRTGPWRHRLKDGSIIQVLITSHSVKFGEHVARLVMAESLTDNPDLEID